MIQECKIHGKTDHYIRKDSGTGRCRKCMVNDVQRRREKIANMAVEYKGGKCQECGYNNCNQALEFHHLDPTTKSFGISKEGQTRSWKRVKDEIDKCVLLCANCHREVHANILIIGE